VRRAVTLLIVQNDSDSKSETHDRVFDTAVFVAVLNEETFP